MFTKQHSDYNLAAHVGSPSGIKAIDQYKVSIWIASGLWSFSYELGYYDLLSPLNLINPEARAMKLWTSHRTQQVTKALPPSIALPEEGRSATFSIISVSYLSSILASGYMLVTNQLHNWEQMSES